MENPIDSPHEVVQYFWQALRTQITRTPHLAPLLLQRSRQLLEHFLQAYAALCRLPRPSRRRWQRRLSASLAGVALALTLGNSLIYAATITVNTNVPDINDDSQCSLIEAIINANNDADTYDDCLAGSDADTITLPAASTHTLTAPYDPIYYTGLPAITSTITIAGNGSTIERVSADPFAILTVSIDGDLTLNETTITGGSSTDLGGAISNVAGKVALNNSTIFSNTAVVGGGIFNLYGTLALTDSVVSGNTAYIYGGIVNASGIMTVTGSTISENISSYLNGGGIANVSAPTVRSASQWTKSARFAQLQGRSVAADTTSLTVVDSTVISNVAEIYGGGILNLGSLLSITGSTIAANTASCCGGGIKSELGTVTLTDSTVVSNTANYDGGGIDSIDSLLTITDSTLRSNQTITGDGGGINIFGGELTILNSTLSNNSAEDAGGGLAAYEGSVLLEQSTIEGNHAGFAGGALAFVSGSAAITNTTISGNTAVSDSGGLYVATADAVLSVADSTITGNLTNGNIGGGISAFANATLDLHRTLVSGNSAAVSGNEIYVEAGGTVSSNFNLFGHSGLVDADAFDGFTPDGTDLTATSDGTNPTALPNILDTTLADNGGDTQTHALVASSPAINAGGLTGPATDQRGLARPQGPAADIGAFEVKLITSSVSQTSLVNSAYNATPTACGATSLPWQTMTPTLRNNTATTFSGLFFKVTTLEYKVARTDGLQPKLCNADVPGSGVGATLTVAGNLAGNGTLTQSFVVGLPARVSYRLYLDLYSTGATAATTSDEAGEYLGSFAYEFDDNGQLTSFQNVLFLPVIVR